MGNDEDNNARLDRWLWSVRLFKTRTLASAACRLGRVRIDGDVVKASRTPVAGDVFTIQQGVMTRTVKVLGIPPGRLGAKRVPVFAEDRTSEEEHEKAREARAQERLNRVFSVQGGGRPTKLQRRKMKSFLEKHYPGSAEG